MDPNGQRSSGLARAALWRAGLVVSTFALGAAQGLMSPAATAPPVPAIAVEEAICGTTERPDEILELERQLAALRSSRSDVRAAVKRSEAEADALGHRLSALAPGQMPLQFPDDLGPTHRPEGFTRLVTEAVARCAPEAKVDAIDCSEYPCVGWLQSPEPTTTAALRACATWDGERPFVSEAYLRTDGSEHAILSVYFLPADGSLREAAARRVSALRGPGMLRTYGPRP